ncbi:MAG: hypothetical protein WDM86_02840 [Rhizomicrobium sp.]
MTAIAHYRKLKVWSQIGFVLLVLMLVPYATFWSYGGHLVSRALASPRGVFVIPAIAFGWIAGFFVFLVIAAVLKQLLYCEGRAVWIEQGMLIFVRRWIFSVRCEEIAKVSNSANGQAVVVHLRDGGEKTFPVGSLKESPAEIIDRLADVLKLPPRQ